MHLQKDLIETIYAKNQAKDMGGTNQVFKKSLQHRLGTTIMLFRLKTHKQIEVRLKQLIIKLDISIMALQSYYISTYDCPTCWRPKCWINIYGDVIGSKIHKEWLYLH